MNNTPTSTYKISKFTKKELDLFFQSAKAAKKNQAFTILIKPSTEPFGKLLVIASRKYGHAPARNLLKRRLKSIFWEEKFYLKRVDCIVIARPSGKLYEFADLKKLLFDVFA